MRLPFHRAVVLRLPSPTVLLTRYPVAWAFLACVAAGEIVLELLPVHQAAALASWASTNVANLHHHPVPALILSAFLPAESLVAWLVIIPIAMLGATRPFGNLWLLGVCAAGHIIGTLVSEGIQAYRLDKHQLPASARTIIDIGPSYATVAAIVLAIGFGSRLARIAAAADLTVLVFIGHIFSRLSQLQVAPVGHLTSVIIAALAGGVLTWLRRRRAARDAPPARATATPPGSTGPSDASSSYAALPGATSASMHRVICTQVASSADC